MNRQKVFVLVLTLLSFISLANIIPKENCKLNYTTVYFEEEIIDGAMEYEIIYSAGLPSKSESNAKKSRCKLPAFWISNLEWATEYIWSVNCYDKSGKLLAEGKKHKFSTVKLYARDAEEFRLVVKKNKETKNAGGLILIDYTKAAFNRSGKQVWVIPNIDTLWNARGQIKDLKVTKDNTLTFIAANIPVEMDYDGTVLWQAPYPFIFNSDTITYHHQVTKTKRGTYLVMGLRPVLRKVFGAVNAGFTPSKETPALKKIGDTIYKRAIMTVLLEFDKQGKVIWSWDPNDYLTDLDMNYKKYPSGIPIFSTHANAFSENQAGTKIYVGFRDINRIVKVDKKTKMVELSYGEKFSSGEAKVANNAFRKQHDAGITNHNSILVLNNDEKEKSVSCVIELKENPAKNDSAVLWKFCLDFDTLTKGKSLSGGNVIELPNYDLLVCAGVLNRVFEVTKSKEVVWDAFVQSKVVGGDTLWQPAPQYRSSWVDKITRYYFIPQLSKVSTSAANGIGVDIVINNTGNADDSYSIEILAEDETVLYTMKSGMIKKNLAGKQSINFKPSKTGIKNLRVNIKSNNSLYKNSLNVNLN